MWLFNKPLIYKQIEDYGRNGEFLMEFAKLTKLERIQDVRRDDLKLAYTELVEPQASLFYRIESVKYINKFLKHYGMPFILATDEVVEFTPNDAIVEAMKTVSMYNPTPRTKRNRRIVELKDKGWSYTEIAAEMGLRAKSTVCAIYLREKKRAMASS